MIYLRSIVVLIVLILSVGASMASSAPETGRKPGGPQGITSLDQDQPRFRAAGRATPAPPKAPAASRGDRLESKGTPGECHFDRGGWEPADSLMFDAFIPAGGNRGVFFDAAAGTLSAVSDADPLTQDALDAVDAAPAWIRPLLSHRLGTIDATHQQRWSEIINSAADPMIDEIAFCVANVSAVYLSSELSNPALFVENAGYIYGADPYFDYVEIIDYGTSAEDDYYSTIRYRKIAADSSVVEIEAPREIYYWYLVHPKISDEIPAYIDPDLAERKPKHSSNIADPPAGVFWRDFLLRHADDGYPILGEELLECTGVWDYTDSGNEDMALRRITDWILDSLDFDSDWERPHQPVRIYRKHIGRCGEHQDIAAAAARAALIPCRGISSISTDHVWNEFWDEDWVHWEPVNNSFNDPMVYEGGWGKVFASVFAWRSDGVWRTVTDRYSEGLATITISVVDTTGAALDGASITLGVPGGIFGYTTDNFGRSGNDGSYTFTVGEGRAFAMRIDSGIGNYPEDPYEMIELVEETVDGGVYEYEFVIDGEAPRDTWIVTEAPPDTLDDFLLEVTYSVPFQEAYGSLPYDDIGDAEEVDSYGLDEGETGALNFFCAAPEEAERCFSDSSFQAFNADSSSSEGSVLFDIPAQSSWYAFLNNGSFQGNPQHAVFEARLYTWSPSGADSGEGAPAAVFTGLGPNQPNPFNPATTIPFSIESDCRVRLAIYDMSGRLVKVLADGPFQAGNHSAVWDGATGAGGESASGVYLCRLTAGGESYLKRLVLMK